MTRRSAFLGVALLLIAVPLPPRAAAAEVRAGVARTRFILPEKIPLAGYSRRRGAPSQGVHDPVGVRALILQEGETTAALVSCDLLIVDERLVEAVRRRLNAHGLPEGLVLVLAATHTHSGPGAYGTTFFEKLSMGHFDPTVFDALAEQIARTVVQAHETLAPVQQVVRSTMTSGLVKNRVDPSGPVDGEVTVCALYRSGEREPFAVVVGFAAHPTTLGAWNRQLSADYPGVLARDVEGRFPTATCLFFAGAVGDQAPVKQGSGFEAAERLGHALASHVIALLENAGGLERPDALQALQETVPLPTARVRLGRLTLPRWLGRRLVDDDATLSAVAVGQAVFLGVPCDLSAALGETLKRAARAHRLQPMILGFAEDYIGYCLPEALYRTRTYEASMAFNGPTTGELIVNRMTQMIDKLSTRDGRHAANERQQGVP